MLNSFSIKDKKELLIGLFVIATITIIVIAADLSSKGKITLNLSDATDRITPALYFETASSFAAVGEEFEVKVMVDTGNKELSAASIRVNYPSSILQAISFTKADFLPVQLGSSNLNASENKAEIALGANLDDPKAGVGTLATLKFKVLSDSLNPTLTFDQQTKLGTIGTKINNIGSTESLNIAIFNPEKWATLVEEIVYTEDLGQAIQKGRDGGLVVEDTNLDPNRLVVFKDANTETQLLTIRQEAAEICSNKVASINNILQSLSLGLIPKAHAQSNGQIKATICYIDNVPIHMWENGKFSAIKPKNHVVKIIRCTDNIIQCEKIRFAIHAATVQLNKIMHDIRLEGTPVPSFSYQDIESDDRTNIPFVVEKEYNPRYAAYARSLTTLYNPNRAAMIRVFNGSLKEAKCGTACATNIMFHELLHLTGLANDSENPTSPMYEGVRDPNQPVGNNIVNAIRQIYRNNASAAKNCIKYDDYIKNDSSVLIPIEGTGGDDPEIPPNLPPGSEFTFTYNDPNFEFSSTCTYIKLSETESTKTGCEHCLYENGVKINCFKETYDTAI